MKFTQKNNDQSTIRKVWSNDKKVCYGIVGTVGDLLARRILVYCDHRPEAWLFIPAEGVTQQAWFGSTRESALENIKE